jgi:glycosyltransferase 2 family protein
VILGANFVYIAAAVGVYFVDLAIRALRWQILLSATGAIPARRLYPVLAVGYMANNVLPGRVGELSRAYLVAQREHVSASAVLATVAIERVIDGLTVLVLLLAALALMPGASFQVGWLGLITQVAMVTFGLALVAFVALLVARRFWLELAGRIFRRLPRHLGARLVTLFDRFISGLDVLRDPREVSLTIGLSVLVWLVGAVTYLLVAGAFGEPLSIVAAVATICVVNLATAIPQAPGGLGAFEAAAQGFLTLLGATATTAFGVTIVLHGVLFVPVVIVGLLALWRMELPLLARRGTKTSDRP